MILRFLQVGLECPIYLNPADVAFEIASGEYGENQIDILEKEQVNVYCADSDFKLLKNSIPISSVVESMYQNMKFHFTPSYYLLLRSLVITIRDPVLNGFRLVQHIFVAIILIMLYISKVGTESGCLNGKSSIEYLRNQEIYILQNIAFIFFSIFFLSFAAMMPTVMVFPLEMAVFL